MKPPFGYFGAKTALSREIILSFPRHRHYVEVFAGSLAVLLAKPMSAAETVSDLDGALVNFWKVLRDRPEELIRACALTPHARAELRVVAREDDCPDDLERARRVWVQLSQGWAGVRNTTGWRYFVGASCARSMPQVLDGLVARMEACSARLRRVSLECLPAAEMVRRYGVAPDALIYADPPYLLNSHDGAMDAGGYAVGMADELSHRELAAVLRESKAAVVLSGYAHPLYDEELYPDWYRTELNTFSANALARTPGRVLDGRRTEVLWSNRQMPAVGRRIAAKQTHSQHGTRS
jgi:DNA adenine methylase